MASNILASVSVVLGAEIGEFRAKMAEARKELRGLVQFADGMKDVGESLTKFVTLPLLALGAGAIKVGSDFESAFNRVEAATQASGAELLALKEKAKGIALDPKLKFSAVDAAQALEGLAKNGLSTAQILGGAADATVNLATATGGNLATAADIATDAMNNFNLTAGQLASSVDSITGTTIASKLDIDNYRQALGQAGGVAGQLGVQFSDFNTALAVTSSGFTSGSDAGTSFKTFLQRLVPQSNEAKAAMQQLGLKFFDAQGQMRPLRDIAGQLQQAFKGLSDQQKNELGTKIFGADSIRTALLLAKDGAEGFDKMAQSIGKVNAAAQGATLSQGFAGALQGLKSAAEGLGIAIAESGILEFGTKIVRALGEFVSGLAKTDPAILRTIVVLAGVAAAIGPVLVAIGTLGVALPAITAGFATLGITSAAALVPVLLPIAAIAAGAVLIFQNWDQLRPAFAQAAATISTAITQIKDALGSIDTGNSFGDLLGSLDIVDVVVKEIAAGVQGLADTFGGVVAFITNLCKGDLIGALEGVKQTAEGLFAPLLNAFGIVQEKANKLKGSFEAAFRLPGGFDGTLGAVGDFSDEVDNFGNTVDTAAAGTDKLAEALAAVRASLRDVVRQNQALGDIYDLIDAKQSALESGIKTLVSAGFSPFSKEVRELVLQLQKVPALVGAIGALELKQDVAVKLASSELPTTLKGKAPAKEDDEFALLTDKEARFRQFTTSMAQLTADLSNAVGPLLAGFAGQFGDAFGSIVTGTASAGDALAGLFSGVLKSLAGFMGTFGKNLIAIGIGKIGLEKLFKASGGGALAVAAGLGLVALAGVASALASSSGKSLDAIGSGGSSGGGSTTRSGISPTQAPGLTNGPGGPNNVTHKIEFTLPGHLLTAALAYETERSGRVLPRR